MHNARNGNALKRYDVELPNKGLVQSLNDIGITLAVVGVLLAIALFVWWLRNPWYSYDSYGDVQYSSFQAGYFLIPAVLVVVGVILILWPGSIFRHYYRRVYQGRVVSKDTYGGGSSGLNWYITIRGYTYANELRYQTFPISAGTWQSLRIGDTFEAA